MAELDFRNIRKVYDTGQVATDDFCLKVHSGEFVVLVGPSGSGKTTLLRMIAGLESITSGQLFLDEREIGLLSPKDRDIAMVFQRYTLFPHYTIRKNIALAVKKDKNLTKDELDARVVAAARTLGIESLLDRKPNTLSGGERQRASLARAIIREPKVLLLDEPLASLDSRLRTEIRAEISRVHNALGATCIYVTHDQVEAMSMADRIVVLDKGKIKQIGTPREIYDSPCDIFVASFFGTPQMNLFDLTFSFKNNRTFVKFFDTVIELTDRQASLFDTIMQNCSDGYNNSSDGYNNSSDGYNNSSDGYNNRSDGYSLTVTAGIRSEDITVEDITQDSNKRHNNKKPDSAEGQEKEIYQGYPIKEKGADIYQGNLPIKEGAEIYQGETTIYLTATVQSLEELGSETLCYASFKNANNSQNDDNANSTDSTNAIEPAVTNDTIIIRIDKNHELMSKSEIRLAIDLKSLHLFDKKTGKKLTLMD